MVTLKQLLDALPAGAEVLREAALTGRVEQVTGNSNNVRPGSLFVALAGESVDGHDYIGAAVASGCCAVVAERAVELPAGIGLVRVPDSRLAYGNLAAAFYGYPAREMKVIGLTGTNGKTTTSWIIEQMLQSAGKRTGVIGTVNYRYSGSDGPVVLDAPLTTPEPVMLQRLLREMLSAGITHVILEVSSHALAQQRLAGMRFDVAVFTNLSRDHLDYHQSMEDYFAAKKKLFSDYLTEEGSGVIVVDDGQGTGREKSWGGKLVSMLSGQGFSGRERAGRKLISCGFAADCRVRAENLRQNMEGFSCDIVLDDKREHLQSGLIGRHNVLNMLSAAGAGMALGLENELIGTGLRAVEQVPGRLERVTLPSPGAARTPRVFVDYAHTPDALANVLGALRPLTPGRLICVFGCGGDRDRGKRPLMGQIAGSLADRLIVTSDNPRTEEPGAILREIEDGLRQSGIRRTDPAGILAPGNAEKKYLLLEDRRTAIHTACSLAGAEDVVLIAGKGHEIWQLAGGERRYFDDRLEAKNGILRWTVEHLLAAVGGELISPGRTMLLEDVSTDSRILRPNDIFVALKGENFDGHDFLAAAVDKGAGALLISEGRYPIEGGAAVIRVDDTLRALGDLASYRRRALGEELLVAAITGSSGKTTVKEMTGLIFESRYGQVPRSLVLKTAGNLNNLIGLPLTLLQVDGGHKAAILEMGMNRPGEIARLTEIARPDIGCITNIQPAHLEGLGSIEGVAAAKRELFATMPLEGTVRVVNLDDPYLRSEGGKDGDSVIGFGVTPTGRRHQPKVRAIRIKSLGAEGMRFTLRIGSWNRRITVPAAGAHNVANCTAAAAIATAAGIEPEVIVRGLGRYRSGDKRLQIVKLANGLTVVNDSYNANPSSMRAALETVRGFGGSCRRAAVLGDMLELGGSAALLHRQIGGLAAGLGFDFLAVTGGFAGEVAAGAREQGMEAGRIITCAGPDEIVDWLSHLQRQGGIGSGDWILIKGSRGMRMERVLTGLCEQWGEG